jgi:hypothetical protein
MKHELQRWLAALLMTASFPAAFAGCVDLSLPLPSAPFVVQGTFEQRSDFGRACPVWVDVTGVVYHLFQDEALPNADFDAVTTPGARSRLLVVERFDLTVGCLQGPTLEVQEVLGSF